MHFSSITAATAIALALVAGNANAHLGRGVPHNFKVREVLKPGSGAMTIARRAPAAAATGSSSAAAAAPSITDESSEESLTSASEECTAYNYPGMSDIKAGFPTVWTTADIMQGDTQANQVWQNIQNSGIIPSDVKQKGTGGKGNFTDVTPNYPSSDPDCWYEYHKCVTPKHPGLNPDIWECPEPDTWGLTFDDGPNCTHNKFYDFLKQNNQKATLFYIGSNIMDWPAQGQRGVQDGHHICVHTWSHQYMTQLTDTQVFAELYYTGKAIKDILGITARCWRPPYGDVDDRVRAIAQGLGMSTNVWSDDTEDWQIQPQGTLPTSSIIANYESIINADYSTHGNIVLTHEINAQTMDEMMSMYPTIKQHFKNIVPITACMNQTNPYPENVVFPDFADYTSGKISPTGYQDMNSFKITNSTYNPVANSTSSSNSSSSSGTSSSSNKSKSSGAISLAGMMNSWSMIVCSLLATFAVGLVA